MIPADKYSMATFNPGDLPSWMLLVIIGIGLAYASTNGLITQFNGLGRNLVFAGLALGGIYFAIDLSRKLL